MNELNRDYVSDRTEEETGSDMAQPNDKQPLQEPRLTFVEPKLVEVGELAAITSGFFTTFHIGP